MSGEGIVGVTGVPALTDVRAIALDGSGNVVVASDAGAVGGVVTDASADQSDVPTALMVRTRYL